MATDTSFNPVTVEQAAISFGTIAELAETVHQLCIEVIAKMSDPSENAPAIAVAARELASQIGLLADVGAASLGRSTHRGVSAVQWLQPPVYPRAAQKEASHG